MMAAPRTVFEARLQAQKPLTAVEQVALELCARFAEEDRQITQEAIREEVGSVNFTGSTSAHILNRLEEKGFIRRTFYQRGVQVCVVATGKCTAQPPNMAEHWRRRCPVPTPTIQIVREKSITDARMIEMIAKQTGTALQDVLAELVHEALDARRLAHDC